jgi:ribosomal protein L40E/DNA-directed RNA polymerase subunit RPC12/RpoP
MISFPCNLCRTPLQAEDEQAGQLVRCPSCRSAMRVPAREMTTVGAGAPSSSTSISRNTRESFTPPGNVLGSRSTGKRYGFNCGYCSSRLEATESQAAQEGQCPTCGQTITIPILDRYGRLIDPKTRQIIKQDPHPVHAYAAAGDRAPKIVRRDKNVQIIICPRCAAQSPITSNNCKSCGMPFTMDGTTLEASGTSNGWCVASLVLGIIGIPASFIVIPPALAIVFGILGFNGVVRRGEGGGKGMAIAGIILGSIGALLALRIHRIL